MNLVFVEKDIDIMGGVERIINTIANNFCANHEVAVISEHKNVANPFFEYDKRIKLYYIQDRSKCSKNNKSRIKKVTNSIKDYSSCLCLNKDIYNCIINADCLIFGRVNTALNFLPLLKKNCKNKKIIVRDAIHLNMYKKIDKIRMKINFPKVVDYLIVSSDESLNMYKDFFAYRNKNRINLKKIYNPLGIMPKVGYKYDSKNIVSLGRLDKQKGFENLILAFSIVNEKHPDWKLSIYGKGNYEKVLKKIIKENKIKNVFIRNQEKDVVKIFNESSMYVMPSRYEGYANSLVEALACGIPSISYNWLTGPEEIIENNVNGIIVNVDDRLKYLRGAINQQDIEDLAQAIIYLIENRDVCEKFNKNSIKIIESRDTKKIIGEWEKIIKSN